MLPSSRRVSHFNLTELAEERKRLEDEMGREGFWDDVEAANKVNMRMKSISSKLDKYSKLISQCEDFEVLMDMGEEDEDLAEEVPESFEKLKKAVEDAGYTLV